MTSDVETISMQEQSASAATGDERTIANDPMHPVYSDPSRQYQVLLLFAGFMMTFNVIGFNQIFGVFQEYYTSPESAVVDAQGKDAAVSLVGSIGSGLTWSGGILVNPIMARSTDKQLKLLALCGAVTMSVGLLLASFSRKVSFYGLMEYNGPKAVDQLWQLYLTQALMYRMGSALFYFPIISLTPLFFDGNRAFAMGIVLSGSGVGGLVLAPVIQTLIAHYGVTWALRIFAAWNVGCGIIVASIIRKREGFSGNSSRTRVNLNLVRKGTFIYQSLGAFLQAGGNVIPMYYMASYSVSVLSYPQNTASLFISVNSAVNSLSRILMGILADRVGRQNTLIAGAILSAMAVFGLWYDAPRERFISFIILYGVYAGGFNALLPTSITEIYGDANYSSVNGFIYFIRGLGTITAAPLAGLILGSYSRRGGSYSATELSVLQNKYNHVVIYDGLLLLVASICVGLVRWYDAKEKGQWKWKA